MLKKIILGVAIVYTTILHLLLVIHFSDNPVARAVLLMGFTLFIIWVVFGSWIQHRVKNKYLNYLSRGSASPVIFFTLWAVGLACLEEVVTTSITNSAPLFGVRVGEAYITASANYFDVIALHSVIVFIPMLFTLGLISRALRPIPTAD